MSTVMKAAASDVRLSQVPLRPVVLLQESRKGCESLTERGIRHVVPQALDPLLLAEPGAVSIHGLAEQLGEAGQCGSCRLDAEDEECLWHPRALCGILSVRNAFHECLAFDLRGGAHLRLKRPPIAKMLHGRWKSASIHRYSGNHAGGRVNSGSA